MRNQLVVALDPTSRIRPDAQAEIWLNPAHLHVFDVDSGDNLTVAVTAGAA
jgi:multiple sugar transport system ATP-binding protein